MNHLTWPLVALAIACAAGFDCYCLSFDYGQRHRNELEAARRIASAVNADHRIIAVDLRQIGGSALTANIAVPKDGAHLAGAQIPATYVPVRNLIFLSLAYALAEAEKAQAMTKGTPGFLDKFKTTLKGLFPQSNAL